MTSGRVPPRGERAARRVAIAAVVGAALLAGRPGAAGEGGGPPPPSPTAPSAPVPSARTADATRVAGAPDAPTPRWRVQASAAGAWSLPAGLEDDRGDVAVRRGGFDVLTTYEVSPRLTVGFDLGAERSTYEFSDRDRVVPGVGRLFEEGTTAYVAPGLRYKADDTWTVSTAVTFATGFAPGGDPADGTTASIVATVKRRLTPSLALLVGGLYSTSIEDDPTILPIVVVMGDGERSTGPVRFEFRGAGVRAAYALSPRVSVAAAARYVTREFRMASDDRVPEGVFRDVRVPVSVELDLHPTPDVTFSGAVGVNAYADVRFDDRRGNELVDAQADVGVWFGVSATIRF